MNPGFLCPFVYWLQRYKTFLTFLHKETPKDIIAEKECPDGRPVKYNNVVKQRAGSQCQGCRCGFQPLCFLLANNARKPLVSVGMLVLAVPTSTIRWMSLNRAESLAAILSVLGSTLTAVTISMTLRLGDVLCCLHFIHREKHNAANTHYDDTNCNHYFLHLLCPDSCRAQLLSKTIVGNLAPL